jgi:hypothetical protein
LIDSAPNWGLPMRTIVLIILLLMSAIVMALYAVPNDQTQDDKIVGCVELGICGAKPAPHNVAGMRTY